MRSEFSPVPQQSYAMPAIPQDVPVYRILKPVYLDDCYCVAGDIVSWDREPNKEMEPLNDMAKVMTSEFFDQLDALGTAASAKNGMKYVPLRRPVEEDKAMNSAASRRVEIIKGDGGVPIMGAKKRGRPAVQKLNVGIPKPEQTIRNMAKASDANGIID